MKIIDEITKQIDDLQSEVLQSVTKEDLDAISHIAIRYTKDWCEDDYMKGYIDSLFEMGDKGLAMLLQSWYIIASGSNLQDMRQSLLNPWLRDNTIEALHKIVDEHINQH